jgi:hypothetical protein
VLGLLVLAADDDAGRQVGDAHRRVGGVDALPARTRGAVDVDADVLVGDVDLVVELRQDRHDVDQRERGLAPAWESNGLMRTSRCTPCSTVSQP